MCFLYIGSFPSLAPTQSLVKYHLSWPNHLKLPPSCGQMSPCRAFISQHLLLLDSRINIYFFVDSLSLLIRWKFHHIFNQQHYEIDATQNCILRWRHCKITGLRDFSKVTQPPVTEHTPKPKSVLYSRVSIFSYGSRLWI